MHSVDRQMMEDGQRMTDQVMLSKIEEYIGALKSSKRLGNQVVFHKRLPEAPPVCNAVESPWPEEIGDALRSMGISALYDHQAKAMDLIRSGKHTVVATPTASGKTLIYNLPALEKIITVPGSKALYIFPLKALAQDQLGAFANLANRMKATMPCAAIYDGDTSAWHRKKIRENLPDVILTNPEMLHLSFLPHHAKWADFFMGLKIVVVDEVHTYRGVMGSHMAQVFRRLLRICRHYGASPTFVFCSATISNPSELAAQLTGLNVVEITRSGAPQGKRHIVFINPEMEGAAQAAIALLKAALHRNMRTIVYTQSRKLTELIALWSQNRSGEFSKKISAYRAGFLPEERRAIEARLAAGELLAVVSTSALELGIDIGDLDLCLLVGYPGTVISTLQRGGRVGRSGQDSALVLIAGEDALDQYFMRHPGDLVLREPEAAVINPCNPDIVSRHLICAAAELPIKSSEPYIAEKPVQRILEQLTEKGQLLQSAAGDEWLCSRKMPHREVDLRGAGRPFAIIDAKTDQNIGGIDMFRAFKETHPGAIYLHMGETFEVETLDIATHTVKALRVDVKHYTRVLAHKDTEILEVYEEKKVRNITVCTGRLKVTEQVTGYDKWAIYAKKRLNRIELDLPPLMYETDGLWFNIPDAVRKQTENKYLHFMGGIHAIEHAAIGIFPLLVLTDRNDLGGISTVCHPQAGGPAVFIYDGTAGGAGLTRQAFKRAEDLLRYTQKAVSECSCENGCPSCVHSPKCGSGNRPIDKAAALFILEQIISSAGKPEQPVKNQPIPHVAARGQTKEKTPVPRRSAKIIRRIRGKKRTFTVPPLPVEQNLPSAAGYFGVLDIETQRSADEVGGWDRADLMRVSCAVLYDSQKDAYLEFLEDQVDALIDCLKQMDVLIGFNIKRFDFKVLSGYTDFDFQTLNTIDILEDIHARLGYRLSLDHLSRVTLGAEKTADGLAALRWWKQGKIRQIIDYCRADVKITKELFTYGKVNGYLLFNNKAGQTVRVPVKW
jgi:DEAD/DEAH box helicase domain-containing protein